ncbi:MAG TPA: FAD-dependent oxidoreductase [Candidatus Dormibacteraeota bacterium]|nr:FAD-dependent oxidoreductase [Candidatus Dormibacteraeota bacterium]
MSQPDQFEILILGSGKAGKRLAWHMAQTGRRTAVVERRWIGGSCPNVACLPSKNEIWGARVAHLARHGAQFGIVTGPVTTDMGAVRQRKRDMVHREVARHLQNYHATGVELVMGEGQFVAPKTLEVRLNEGGARVLTGDRVFVNVGTHPAIPDVAGLKAVQPLTHVEALELDYVPEHLILLGGGYVCLEMAQAYRRFGSRVTVIEAGPQLLGQEDSDLADEMQRFLAEEDIKFLIKTEPLRFRGRSGKEVGVTVRSPFGEQRIEGSDLLVAAGRVPNTDLIGLKDAGLALDSRGYIRVNERLETTASDVWAMGECCGSPPFTHVAADDFRIIRDNLAGGHRTTRDRLVPYCVFTDPPLARVGLSERDAQLRGISARVARLPMRAVSRTETTDETQGFMKALVGSDDRILGFSMIGAEAGEVMAVVQTAMLAGLPYPILREAILTHPTMAEGLGPLFENIPPQSETRPHVVGS